MNSKQPQLKIEMLGNTQTCSVVSFVLFYSPYNIRLYNVEREGNYIRYFPQEGWLHILLSAAYPGAISGYKSVHKVS